MTAQLYKIKDNVHTMIAQNATEKEINSYLAFENVTPAVIRNLPAQQEAPVPVPQQKSGAARAWETTENMGQFGATGETAAHLATASYGVPASGFGGIAAGLATSTPEPELDIPGEPGAGGRMNWETADKVRNVIQDLLVYQPQTKGGKQLTKAAMYPLEKWEEKVGKPITEKYGPTAGTIASGVPFILAGGHALTKGKFSPTVEVLNKNLAKTVKTGIEKGVRPSVAGKKTGMRYEKFIEKGQLAVESIIENKNNLQLTNAEGKVVTGQVPENLVQASEAVTQTLQKTFNEYNDLVTKANGQGVVIELEPIAAKLDRIAVGKVEKTMSPDVTSFATEFAERLRNDKSYTAQEAQHAIATLNEKLKPQIKNPTYEGTAKAHVHEAVVTELREMLDAAVENATGEQYQVLKHKYGALKAIEQDVKHRMIIDARKSPSSFYDISDVFSGFHGVKGLFDIVQRSDPTSLTAATAAKGVSKYYKHIGNPNRSIKIMFRDAEKLTAKRSQLLQKQLGEVPDQQFTDTLVDGLMLEYFPEHSASYGKKPIIMGPKGPPEGPTPLTKPRGPVATSGPIPGRPPATLHPAESGLPETAQGLLPSQTTRGTGPTVKSFRGELITDQMREIIQADRPPGTPQALEPNIVSEPPPVEFSDIVQKAKAASVKAKPRGAVGTIGKAKVEIFRDKSGIKVKQGEAPTMSRIKKQRLKEVTEKINKLRKEKGLKPFKTSALVRVLQHIMA